MSADSHDRSANARQTIAPWKMHRWLSENEIITQTHPHNRQAERDDEEMIQLLEEEQATRAPNTWLVFSTLVFCGSFSIFFFFHRLKNSLSWRGGSWFVNLFKFQRERYINYSASKNEINFPVVKTSCNLFYIFISVLERMRARASSVSRFLPQRF